MQGLVKENGDVIRIELEQMLPPLFIHKDMLAAEQPVKAGGAFLFADDLALAIRSALSSGDKSRKFPTISLLIGFPPRA